MANEGGEPNVALAWSCPFTIFNEIKARIAPRETTEAIIKNSIKLGDNMRLTDGGEAAPCLYSRGKWHEQILRKFAGILCQRISLSPKHSADWTGSVSLPLMPVVEVSVELAASRDKVATPESLEGVAVAIDLQTPLMRLGAIDGVYVVLEDIPSGVRFSAGRCNSADTWSLAPGELEGLYATLPATRMHPFVLAVRVLTPDPCGYEYASTAATFDVVVEPGATPRAVTAFSRCPHQTKPLGAIVALPDDPRAAEDRRLATARAEWHAEAALQLERAHTQWEAAACEQWAAREAALRAQHVVDLAEIEARWRRREADRIAMAEAQCNARAATKEMRRLAEETRWLPAKPVVRVAFRGGRIYAGLVTVFGIACIALSVWTL